MAHVFGVVVSSEPVTMPHGHDTYDKNHEYGEVTQKHTAQYFTSDIREWTWGYHSSVVPGPWALKHIRYSVRYCAVNTWNMLILTMRHYLLCGLRTTRHSAVTPRVQSESGACASGRLSRNLESRRLCAKLWFASRVTSSTGSAAAVCHVSGALLCFEPSIAPHNTVQINSPSSYEPVAQHIRWARSARS